MKQTDKTSAKRHCMIVFAPYPLGETRVQREAEALLRDGYEVDVICMRMPGEPARGEYKGVRIFREEYQLPFGLSGGTGLSEKFLKYLRFFFAAGWRVTQLNFQRKYATIQVHNLPDFLVFCTLIPKLLGATVILDLHDLMPEFYAGRFGEKSFGVRLVRWQERWSCRFADHVITVSEHWRQSLIKRGVSPAKCSVVMNVADDAIFHPLNGGGANRKAHQGFRLIYHGSMHQRYGLDLAVQAVHRLREEIPDIHLMLVGAGPFLTTLRSMVDELGIQANVSIEPLHLAEELPEIISSCDLGLVPYRSDVFTDGLVPTKLLEYAAMELPAVAARTTAIQAYFEDTNTEFFEPDDLDDLVQCILKLYKDPQRLCELAQGSQKFNSRYSWAAISAEYTRTVRALGKV